jgi:hypothetical protein
MTNGSLRRDPEKPGPIAIETAYNALVISRNAEIGSRWNAAQVGIILNAPDLGGAIMGLFQRPPHASYTCLPSEVRSRLC